MANSNSERRRRIPRWGKLLIGLGAFALLLIVIAISIPTLDGPRSRLARNEATAVGGIRRTNDCQREFAGKNPKLGFSTEFSKLHEFEADSEAFLLMDRPFAGYIFALRDFRRSADGRVEHYQITEVPKQQGVTGFRAFCSDETGMLWSDSKGDGERCLRERKPLD